VTAWNGAGDYRFLLSRRWLGLLLVALLVSAACVLLGRWQWHRLEHRRAANHLVTSNVEARPVPPTDLVTTHRGPAASEQWRRVRATGRYDVDHQLLVRNRPYDGAFGYHVLVPLVTDRGPALLVDRGWVPNGESASDVPDVPPPPAGQVTVLARLRPSEPASTTGTPPPGQVTRIDVSSIRRQLPYPVYGGFAELVRERPRPRHAPALLPLPELSEGPHLAYAVQWWLFAGMALVGYGILARREAADRRTTADDARPAIPARVTG
jgi:cytochrome oxidase assembly protein ShyY1